MVWWLKTKTTLKTKNSCGKFFYFLLVSQFKILFSFLFCYFSIKFFSVCVLQVLLDSYQMFLNLTKVWLYLSLRLSEDRRLSDLYYFALSFTTKINFCSILGRSPRLYFRSLSLLGDYGSVNCVGIKLIWK